MPNENFLPFAKPDINEDAINEVVDSLRSGWLTTGPKVKRFSDDLAAYLGAPFALPLASATAGLQLSLMGANIGPGDEVITTPMTFVATLNTIIHAGAKPVLVDASLDDYNIIADAIEDCITDKTKAIVPVHFAGLPVDLDPIYHLAEKYQLRVIEDAAHAIGAEYKGKRIGSFGDTQVFSFHPNKNMTTGEGGAITTRDEALAEHIALLRFHGMDREAWNRFGKSGSQHYEILQPGFKYNMMDIQAALGIHQLKQLDSFNAQRAQWAARYYEALRDFPAFKLPKMPSYAHKHAWHLFSPLLQPDIAGMTRDDFMAAMKEHNIGTGLHYRTAHLYPYYQTHCGFKAGQFPNAEYISDRIVSLPLFPSMTEHDFTRVLDALHHVLKGA